MTFILIFTEKTFSSVVFFLVIVFTFLLLYIIFSSKLCPLQIDINDCNVSCAFPHTNAPVSFTIFWMGCHFLLLPPCLNCLYELDSDRDCKFMNCFFRRPMCDLRDSVLSEDL